MPIEELRKIALGEMQPASESAVRDEIGKRKKVAAQHLTSPTPDTAITADSPIPFSIKKLWFDLDDFERQTFEKTGGKELYDVTEEGNAETLKPNEYPTASPYNTAPSASDDTLLRGRTGRIGRI